MSQTSYTQRRNLTFDRKSSYDRVQKKEGDLSQEKDDLISITG